MKQKQSLSGFIRQHLSTFEAQIEAGIRQEAIVEELASSGFNTTVAIFRTLLYRARIRAASKATRQQSEQSGSATIPISTTEKKPSTTGFEYDTKNIDPSKLF